jgi:hypothetical protein
LLWLSREKSSREIVVVDDADCHATEKICFGYLLNNSQPNHDFGVERMAVKERQVSSSHLVLAHDASRFAVVAHATPLAAKQTFRVLAATSCPSSSVFTP